LCPGPVVFRRAAQWRSNRASARGSRQCRGTARPAQERREPGGRVIVEEPGGRMIVRDRGVVMIHHDEVARFGRFGPPPVITRRGAENFAVVRRPGGVEIVTMTDVQVATMLRRWPRARAARESNLTSRRFGNRCRRHAAVWAPSACYLQRRSSPCRVRAIS